MNFKERKISNRQAISILAKYGIDLDYNEANIILDFLYLLAKNYDKREKVENSNNPKREIEHS